MTELIDMYEAKRYLIVDTLLTKLIVYFSMRPFSLDWNRQQKRSLMRQEQKKVLCVRLSVDSTYLDIYL